ncbi:MAG: leucine-rich repeat domain-containing protein [Bacteroidaceae bacterium]|nr:leucine-rich repeat domain-containing protein [Bacteroidaceae bacterium]
MKLLNLKFLCLFMCLFSCIKTFPYDAFIDGIYYNFNENEAEVTYENTSYNSYTGDIVIPESVVYNAKTYSVTSIGNGAFRNCSGLTSVTIHNSVTSIGSYAFSGCSGLTSVNIPNSVTSIVSRVFYNCTGLTTITIPNSVTSIESDAFSGCSGLTSVTIPNSVTSIGGYAFSGCSGLTSVNIPNSVTSIGSGTFYGCSGLTSVTIPNSVTSIKSSAFYGCESLTSVTIPNSVTSIGRNAFDGCKLRNVLIKCATPPTGESAFSSQTYYHTTLYVPAGCWDAYAYDDTWYLFHNIRETATEEEQVAMQQAYTLMDAETFTYSVYDPVNNCIGTIKSVSAIDENNPNHSWQVITDGSEQYLYNLGAKKFATNGADGRLVLTAEPTPIDMKNGDNGIVLGSQAAHQWALVGNDRLSVEQDIITGIDEIANTQQGESTSYDLQGRRIDKAQKGINIIRNADGTTKKVLIKH